MATSLSSDEPSALPQRPVQGHPRWQSLCPKAVWPFSYKSS
jgi:hypothetical protein